MYSNILTEHIKAIMLDKSFLNTWFIGNRRELLDYINKELYTKYQGDKTCGITLIHSIIHDIASENGITILPCGEDVHAPNKDKSWEVTLD